MIVCSLQPHYRYTGLSTDIKPTVDVVLGSEFVETDTDREYEWRGDAGWVRMRRIVADEDMALNIYTDGDIMYICRAQPGTSLASPLWQIQKFDTILLRNQWADGNALFDNVATSLSVVKNLNYS
jgi:hypothetical protein